MRRILSLNSHWKFEKYPQNPESIDPATMEDITIPHTWNAIDGTDGGNDYYRGTCLYYKKIEGTHLKSNEKAFLEFQGINMKATVIFNGKNIGSHLGGYSTFRMDVTDLWQEENLLLVYVDNSPSEEVYPQMADFTFYGGIYRDVNLILVDSSHFDLEYYGGRGVYVTASVDGSVEVRCFSKESEGKYIDVSILDHDGMEVGKARALVRNNPTVLFLHVDDPHLWNGLEDPYLYRLVAKVNNDEVQVRFGFRSMKADPEKGFLLNGKPYPLTGVSRHQDREGLGSALTKKEHYEDMSIIKEMGANTIRLAHYQHDEYVYDLADEMGFVIWAEIPYISKHMDQGEANTLDQMRELVVQNYNHPSIFCWGLSNEITVAGGLSETSYLNHMKLNNLCHELDATRPTTTANLFMLEMDSPMVTLPDIRSYNLYFGWYVGNLSQNDSWFDEFHQKYPKLVVGLSEFGADANPQYQGEKPSKGDYSEAYQALYHEHILKMREERPYIWAVHAWNMFDFAADARAEGGKKGINQKGLVTFDRKTKKDAFYAYKAFLSKEPFVHLCGKRYVDRPVDLTHVKVYSNQNKVSLYIDGKLFAEKEGGRIFEFEVPLNGEHRIVVVSGDCSDEMFVRKVDVPNPSYDCPEKMEVTNWFEGGPEIDEEYFSIYDKLADIKANPEANAVYFAMMEQALAAFGDLAKSYKIPEDMQRQMDQMTLEQNLKMAGHMVKPSMVEQVNAALQKIRK